MTTHQQHRRMTTHAERRVCGAVCALRAGAAGPIGQPPCS